MLCPNLNDFCEQYPAHATVAGRISHLIEEQCPQYIDPILVALQLKIPPPDVERTLMALEAVLGVSRVDGRRHADDSCDHWLPSHLWELMPECPGCRRVCDGELVASHRYVWRWRWEKEVVMFSAAPKGLVFISFVSSQAEKLAEQLNSHFNGLKLPPYYFKQTAPASANWSKWQNFAAYHAKAFVMIQTKGYTLSDQCKIELAYACLKQVPIFRIVTDLTDEVTPLANMGSINWLLCVSEDLPQSDVKEVLQLDWINLLNSAEKSDFVIPAMHHLLSSKSVDDLTAIAINCRLGSEVPSGNVKTLVNFLTSRASADVAIRSSLIGTLAPSAP